MTTAKSEALIREKIGQQLARRSALQYDLEANQQVSDNLRKLISACDSNIRGLEQARSMMAEVEADLASAYASAAQPRQERREVEYVVTQQEQHPPAPKPAKPKAAQAPKPAKRRGRPPKAKPAPIQDEPTQAGGSWNGNGGLTPEQAAAQ